LVARLEAPVVSELPGGHASQTFLPVPGQRRNSGFSRIALATVLVCRLGM
jgi:hypothetical protein